MSDFDETNRFTLFVNDKKGNEKAPDRSGKLNVDGVEYFIDGWIQQGKSGPFLSGKIKRKDKQTGAAPAQVKAQDEDIPF